VEAAYIVLSVGGDEAIRRVRRDVLERAGFRVYDAADGTEALHLAGAAQPALVLLDGDLPDLNGFSVCEWLKAHPETALIPVVQISASERADADPAKSRRGSSDACLREPVEAETLVSVVRALIRARESQREIVRAEQEYRNVVQTALEGIWVLDPCGTIQFANTRMADLLQYSPEELRGRAMWELTVEEDRERLEAEFHRRFTEDSKEPSDLRLRRQDGKVVWLSGAGRNVCDDGGAPVARTAVFIDITQRKLAQDALIENQERLQLAFDVAELGAWEVDLETRVVTAAPRTCAMFGFSASRPQLEDWIDRIHPEDRERVRRDLTAAIHGEAAFDSEHRVGGPDERTRWIQSKARRVADAVGRPKRLVGVSQEITDRKEADLARERQRELFQAIIENIPVMLCIYDGDMRAFQVNPEFERVLGWSTEDALRGDLMERVYPDAEDREELTEYMQALTPGWREFDATTKGGETIPCEWANLRLSDDRRVGIGIDLRPRKEAEQALRESEADLRARAAELQAIMDALPVATFVARDAECRDVIGSRMTYELLRLPEGSNASATVAREQSPPTFRFLRDGREIPARQLPVTRAAATGEPVRDYEFEIALEDGTERNMLGNAVPLLDEHGRPRGAVGAFVDITDRKRAEERLRASQKLESLGLLAGGIAHDFNNLLTAIMGNTSIAIKEAGPGPAARLKQILRSADRAAKLIRQLMTYSGKGPVLARDVDVAQAVSEMRNLMELSVPKSVRLNLDLEQRVPPVWLDPSQLEQILMNLVINAGEAIGEGNAGRIRVSTSKMEVEKGFSDELGSEIPPGRYARIAVSDTGAGIEADVLRKVFDPFFSTKFAGRGLGLAAVAGIVRSHRGAITVNSMQGKGTTFSVLLPLNGDEPGMEEEPQGPARGVVLVVEDDGSVREFIADVARSMGFRVLTACDGADAMAACEREAIDAVVLDVVMPGMGGNVLLPLIKERLPEARILLTSGYNEVDARRLCADFPYTAFVQKPYTADEIAAAIEELTAART